MIFRFFLSVPILLLLFAGISVADDLNVLIHGDVTKDDSLETLSVMLSVIDLQGNGVSGLDSTSFYITCGEDSALIHPSVDLPVNGVGLVMCLDISGTMRGDPLNNVKTSLISYLDSLRPQDRIAIFTFADSINKMSDFSNNSNYLKSVVEGIEVYGSRTLLYQGVHRGLEYFRTSSPADLDERYLLVFSDGKDEDNSPTPVSLNECIELANSLEIPVISVGLGDEVDYLSYLQELSDETGGNFKLASTEDQLNEAFRRTLSITRNKYAITFTVPDSLANGVRREYTIHAVINGQEGENSFLGSMGVASESKNGGMSVLFIVILAGVLILVFLFLYSTVKKRSRQKITVLNSELKRSRDRIGHLEKEVIAGESSISSESSQDIFEVDNGGNNFDILQPRRVDSKVPSSTEQPKRKITRHTMIDTGGESYTKGELVFQNGSETGKIIAIAEGTTTIGKSPECTVVLSDKFVSRKHVTIRFMAHQFQIVDHESRNGTFVNGQRVAHSYLKNGDLIRLGRVELKFRGEK